MLVIITYGLASNETDNSLSRQQKNENYMKLYVSWVITSAGFAYGFGHLFMSDKVANSIGWETGSLFQKEIGYANLSFAIMASFITHSSLNIDAYKACVAGYISFLGGCLIVHIQEIIKNGNYSFNNLVGAPSFSIMNIIYGSWLLASI